MGDEGLGVHIITELQKTVLPEGVDLLDGGTGGFHLLEYFENYSQLILIDATLDNHPTGTIRLITPKFASDFPNAMSSHDIGLRDLVASLQLLDKMPEIYLFVVSIKTIQQQGTELTPEIAAVIPTLKEKILSLVEDLCSRNKPQL
jgi:hydrogenase maturation protease